MTNVEWKIVSHQEQKNKLNGEGWILPNEATETRREERFYDWDKNQIGEEYGSYYVTSTPYQTGETHSQVKYETPGAIFTGEPYQCGTEPTIIPGGSPSFEECASVYQEDSTFVWGDSEATPVYADTVNVLQTTLPTPIYGTPTPINKIYYFYTYWEWQNIGLLPDSSGDSSEIHYPAGQTDTTHRVVVDSETYIVTLTFDNGYIDVIESDNSSIFQEYRIGYSFIGNFNIFGGLINKDRPQ